MTQMHMLHTFQSHNGAIAAFSKQARQKKSKKFQSHNGAIAAALTL